MLLLRPSIASSLLSGVSLTPRILLLVEYVPDMRLNEHTLTSVVVMTLSCVFIQSLSLSGLAYCTAPLINHGRDLAALHAEELRLHTTIEQSSPLVLATPMTPTPTTSTPALAAIPVAAPAIASSTASVQCNYYKKFIHDYRPAPSGGSGGSSSSMGDSWIDTAQLVTALL